MIGLKVCGVQPDDDFSFIDRGIVTHVGAVFVQQSRRFVTPEAARDIRRQLPANVKLVGLFVNTSPEEMMHLAATAEVDVIQLHGNETAQDCKMLRDAGYTVWKSISIPQDVVINLTSVLIHMKNYDNAVDALLLDAKPPTKAMPNVTGGHGVAFDWGVLTKIHQQLATELKSFPPLWVAGGITPENVPQLLSIYQPSGIDVSSGVEVQGRKSLERIQAMMEAVESYERNHSVS